MRVYWALLALLTLSDGGYSLNFRLFGCGGCCPNRTIWLHYSDVRTGDTVKDDLAKRLDDMQACYRKHADRDKTDAYFSFSVSANGVAGKVKFDGTASKASRCVARIVRKARWEAVPDAEPMLVEAELLYMKPAPPP